MSKKEIQIQYKKKIKLFNQYNKSYYDKSKPDVSDKEYDLLAREEKPLAIGALNRLLTTPLPPNFGKTNPEDAEDGTIRKLYATSLGENAVHGSDSDENAKKEIAFFFSDAELI